MKRLTKKQLNEKVKVTCYRRTEVMTRKKAIDEFYEGMIFCDGSEAERYTTIYLQLMEGRMECSDEI